VKVALGYVRAMTMLLQLAGAIIGTIIWVLIVYFTVKAAVVAALAESRGAAAAANQLLGAQADLTARLAKHLIAQTELMLVQARHDGITDAQLATVMTQIEERRAEPGLTLPFK